MWTAGWVGFGCVHNLKGWAGFSKEKWTNFQLYVHVVVLIVERPAEGDHMSLQTEAEVLSNNVCIVLSQCLLFAKSQ